MHKILVTGGAGYIGSHVAVQLLKNPEYSVVLVDNFLNSTPQTISKIRELSRRDVTAYNLDIRDSDRLINVLNSENPDAVVHLAGLKSVSESKRSPMQYYSHNVSGTISLLYAMNLCKVRKLVFSSSATVYGSSATTPIAETSPRSASSVYGQTKIVCEQMLEDLAESGADWAICALRYFNPIGADSSGEIGDLPKGTPNNLIPYLDQVLSGQLPILTIHGNDYPTRDGTGVRDYIHITDLALGHIAAMDFLARNRGFHVFNLGTGEGYTVKEVVDEYARQSCRPIPFRYGGRRNGDVAECVADPSKANQLLGWQAKLTLKDMCNDALRFCNSRLNSTCTAIEVTQ